MDWSTVEPVDILTGGYPCQPFSQAGRRKGENDDRHLWPYVREAIRHLRPRYTILENVRGHRSLGFDRVLGDLAEDGMHVQWTSLRASNAGAPHHRERLFILITPPHAESLRWNEGVRQGGAPKTKPRPRLCEDVLPRWESTAGTAPSFTTSGDKLNPEYAEWMMGIPRWWVTSPEIGLSYKEQLKAIGNGVCPQQAYLALERLFGGAYSA